jgi:magnesium transporter
MLKPDLESLQTLDAKAAAAALSNFDSPRQLALIEAMGPLRGLDVLSQFSSEAQARLLADATPEQAQHWQRALSYAPDTVGRFVERSAATFGPESYVADVVAQLRESIRRTLITYIFVVDQGKKLVGVVTFRELLYSAPTQMLSEIMIKNPYFLRPDLPLVDAMREVVKMHFPVYPVCLADGTLVGQVRGQVLFEAQAVDISAQAGKLVGVEKEERLSTPWRRSFFSRHPWLQINLLTAFIAGAVVSFFQGTVDKVALLAVFLPILAGQSGNTGCQALAVTLRGLTLGEVSGKDVPKLLRKEALLGMLNGATVGLVAAIGMVIYARMQNHPQALMLGAITWIAMIGSCIASGLAGASVPLTLKKFGADPATASSIFLTTATDVASMGLFLGLATWLLF